jgi:hypothetical protein
MVSLRCAVFSVFLMAGCQPANKHENDLSWLLTAEPSLDAEQAIHQGDLRYIGISGMFISVPFVDNKCINENTVRLIRVSDVIESYEQKKLQAIAPIYAEAYNFKILQHQKKQGQSQCGT